MTNSSKIKQPLLFSVLSIISICIAAFAILGLINFFTNIVPLGKYHGLQLIAPFFIAPFGLISALISLLKQKSKIALFGVIINIVLCVFPIAFNIVAVLLFGP